MVAEVALQSETGFFWLHGWVSGPSSLRGGCNGCSLDHDWDLMVAKENRIRRSLYGETEQNMVVVVATQLETGI